MRKKSRLIISGLLIAAFLTSGGFMFQQAIICKALVRSYEILKPVEVPEEDITPQWMLTLVNTQQPLSAELDFPKDTINGYTFDARAIDDLRSMLEAAKDDGINLLICSAYRSVAKQTELFERKVKQYQNAGYSYEDAYNIAKTIVAIPGTSEHHTGLAADIITVDYQVLDEGFANTSAYQWLKENCTKYGFIMRYPKEKQDITGIIYEPWHYRYVGKNAAEVISANDWCLEEYIEQLKSEQEEKAAVQTPKITSLIQYNSNK